MQQNKKIAIQIEGMTCQSCANRIEKVLNRNDFVSDAGVNFAAEEAHVVFDSSQASEQDILTIIQKAGFNGILKQNVLTSAPNETKISPRLWLLLFINIPFLIGIFVLASIVQLGLAIPFYKGAIGSIRGGLANMDVLVSTGTLAIYLYSVFMLFYHQSMGHDGASHVYFEASVMVIGFVSLGKFLEERTKKQSLNSLGLLLQLTPKQVSVQRENRWETIPLDQVKIGDILRANQGERIAADGVVEQGSGWCDESHLTGESQPLEKMSQSPVLAGAMVTQGSLIYRATQLGQQTLLGDMMKALSEAQGTKAPIARFADKVAAVFVPAVLLISAITFGLTWWIKGDWVTALIHSVAVLVIACPCALGLATPAAIMVGMGKAVNAGIWFKDAASMEEAAHVDTVVLDKTGTLTQGELKIADVWQPQSAVYSEADLYRIAASVEQNANHPLAKAIVLAAQEKSLEIPTALSVHSEVGQGISAHIDGIGLVKVGKPTYCELILPDNMPQIWQIASIVAVSVDNSPIGAFALADSLKEDSLQAIQRLHQHNIDVVMMSGDQQSVVDYVAQQVGVKTAQGNCSPRDKAAYIERLRQQGKVVAMVGDGVNDAPALAMANVSFAMKSGSDVAEQTASATLMQHSVNQLVDGLMISRATLKNIKQTLGYLSPVLAGAAMAMSSLSVLSNALRLKRVKIK